ncbi:MAG TPA: dihydroorotate dehydrogenase electron transfer subunit [Lachnospiraceae bacterium]|jgi:dihydroorotate dehydrogenase electron transfer subunit|nr:dihydroorotate dehydrogenase electron transfer subunit [Lachnospiraceae bacterium]
MEDIKLKKNEEAMIQSMEEISQGVYSLWIETTLAREAKPGQFLMVYLKNPSKLLGRPISICDVDREKGLLRMVFRTIGEGTKELAAYQKGTKISVLGTLGNGYDPDWLKDKKVIVMGGGIGIPPMLLASKTIVKDNISDKTPEIVLGYANQDLFLKEEFDAYANVSIATMDGSVGTKGTVLDAMKEKNIQGDVIIACGPMPMLRAVKQYAAEHQMEAYISLEERMACGVGACLGCVCKTVKKDFHTHVNKTRICVEGPVFDAKEVEI